MVTVERIHQIMIVDGFGLPEKLTGFFLENKVALKKLHKKATYKMWGGRELQDFIGRHFSKDVLETFCALEAYAYKADLARLCVLYVYGGLYVDLGVRLMRPFDVPAGKKFFAYRDLFQESNWFMIQNGLIYAEKGRPELKYAIRWIVENRRNRFYGENSLFPTGPVQLGRAVAYVAATTGPGGDPAQWIGECRPLTPSEPNKNMVYSCPSGTLSAVRAKIKAGDLAHMGLTGGNNHNTIWQARRVYGETTARWTSSDKQIRIRRAKRTEQGIFPVPLGKGLMTWGPYFTAEAGTHLVRLNFASFPLFDKLVLEICCNPDCTLVEKKTFYMKDVRKNGLEMIVSTKQVLENIELKLYKGLFFLGHITSFEVEKI